MSSLGSPNPLLFGGAKDYTIGKSLRFNPGDSTYLTRSVSGAGTLNTMTFSFWVKRAASDAGAIYSSGVVDARGHIYFSGDQLYIQPYNNPSANKYVYTAALFRDFSAWYHVVIRLNGMTLSNIGTAITVWVNGVQKSTTVASAGSCSEDPRFNDAQVKDIGRFRPSGGYFSGYLAEFHFVDGTALDHTSFGETNADTGQWVPIEVSGVTYGTNGFYLPFTDNSGTTATTLGKDSAGSNNYTPNNFSVAAGVGNDSLTDTPTNNYATLNVLAPNHVTITNGNLDWNTGTAQDCASTFGLKSGKWYAELTCAGDGQGSMVGIKNEINERMDGGDANTICTVTSTGTQYSESSTAAVTTGGTWTTNDIIGIALDATSKTCDIYKNGSKIWGFTSFTVDGPYYFVFDRVTASGSSFTHSVNFGQRAFSHQVSTYNSVCTANLPEPTIKKGSDHFYTKVYAPDGSASFAVTGVGFQPDLVWLKSREYAEDHQLNDSVRGATKGLQSNLLDEETTQSNGLISFDSDGFTVGNLSDYNYNGDSIVSWNWKESPTAGFDIVKDEGTGSDHTIPHSLGVKPDMMIRKAIDRVDNWMVYHKDLDGADATEYLQLNEAASQANYHEIWNDTPPTNLVFTVGSDTSVNQDGKNYITYLFTSIEGYSKAGKYEGNGNANGPFIYTGFKPAWVMVKVTSSTGYNWLIFDNKRLGYNQENHMLLPNESHEEKTTGYGEIDILSNGFKLRESTNDGNKSGDTIIYLAFAETSFKYATAR